MEYDININLFSTIDLKNEQDPAKVFKIFGTFFYKFGRFPDVEKLAIPCRSISSFVKTDDISHPLSYMNFLIILMLMV